MLLFVTAMKLLAEIALMCLLGQWLLGLLAGAKRDSNPIYKLFQMLTKPVLQAARFIAPKQILDRHMPLLAACLLVFVWLSALILKINVCLQLGMEVCR